MLSFIVSVSVLLELVIVHFPKLVPFRAYDQGMTAFSSNVRVSLDGDEFFDASRVVSGYEGMLEVHDDLLPRHLGIVDGQLGALVHKLLGNIDGGRLPGLQFDSWTIISRNKI